MKRLTLAVVIAGIAVLGVWLGLPIYAESQFHAALDAHFAASTDKRASYQNATLDYWNDSAAIGSITEIGDIEVAGETTRILITLHDVVIDGYDLAAAERALAGADGKVELIAKHIAWAGIELSAIEIPGKEKPDTLAFTGANGSIDGFAADSLDPQDLLKLTSAKADAIRQDDALLEFVKGETSLSAGYEKLEVAGLSASGFTSFQGAQFHATGGFKVEKGIKGAFSYTMADFAVRNLALGDITTFDLMEEKGIAASLAFPENPAFVMPGKDGGATPLQIKLTIDESRIEKGRFDLKVFSMYKEVLEKIMEQKGAQLTDDDQAKLFELLLSMVERAQSSQVGADRLTVTGMKMSIPKLMEQSVDMLEYTDLRILRLGKGAARGIIQTNSTGAKYSIEELSFEGMDMSRIPAYFRKIFGSPVTLESMNAGQLFFINAAFADIIPEFDFGRGEVRNQVIKIPDGLEIKIALVAFDAYWAKPGGDIRMAFSLEGLDIPLAELAKVNARVRNEVIKLQAEDIEHLILHYDLDIESNFSKNTIQLTKASIAGDGLGALDISAGVSGFDIEKLRKLPAKQRTSAALQTVLVGASIGFVDAGLKSRALSIFGKQKGATAEEMAEALAANAEQSSARLQSARAVTIAKAIAAFLRGGGAIKIATAMEKPIAFEQIKGAMQAQGPGAVLELLQIEAVQTPAN